MMTKERVVIQAVWRNGRWHTSDDAPISKRIVAERLAGLAEMVREEMPGVEVEIVTDPPAGASELARQIEECERRVQEAKEALDQAQRLRRLAQLRYEAAFWGFHHEDAGFMLGKNPGTLRNHWSEYRNRETNAE